MLNTDVRQVAFHRGSEKKLFPRISVKGSHYVQSSHSRLSFHFS